MRQLDAIEGADDRLVGDAVLAESAFAKVSGSLVCDAAGLVVGQKVKITNAARSLADFLLIQSIDMKIAGAETAVYTIEFGDYNPDLIELLIAIEKESRNED